MTVYPPLQTHELYDETVRWLPPLERFISYDDSDRGVVCLSSGITLKYRTLKPLYDVRLIGNNLQLAGYTSWNPCDYLNAFRNDRMLLPVIDEFEIGYKVGARPPSNRNDFVEVPTYIRKFVLGNRAYLCWMVPAEFAPALAQAGFIKGYGPDNLGEFSHKMQLLAYKDFRGMFY